MLYGFPNQGNLTKEWLGDIITNKQVHDGYTSLDLFFLVVCGGSAIVFSAIAGTFNIKK